MRPTVRQLQHFIALAHCGQVSKAALRCHISQSSMTASLQRLEQMLGSALFWRGPAGIVLTPAGQRFLHHAQRILADLDQAMDEISQTSPALQGPVRIGLTETVSAYLMASLIAKIQQNFPLLDVHYGEHDRQTLEAMLETGQLDLALMLTANISPSEHLAYDVLTRSPRMLWAQPEHPLILAGRVTLADVAAHDYILLDMDEHITVLDRYWSSRGLRPRITFQSRSIEAVRSLVAAGEGVSILSNIVYRAWSLEGQRIARRPVSDSVPTMDIGVAWCARRQTGQAYRALIDFIRTLIPAA
ncbi:LysR family transcriptional regulator [Sodalis praecaptivus]|uniref:LysR family transcriptional regulator n=1 Tax=Sodalis praecaptivus TaxID=1239307 RepID=W0HTW9_9GAMM|nr:LysR family transcriptional regulator [Sodalis praecaptivus]AHF77296.1 LysR family transcriptional regulator [Sodalis praecaptivus]